MVTGRHLRCHKSVRYERYLSVVEDWDASFAPRGAICNRHHLLRWLPQLAVQH